MLQIFCVTTHGTSNVIYQNKRFLILHQYCRKYFRSAQCSCSLQFLVVLLLGVQLRCYLNDLQIVPVVPVIIIIGISLDLRSAQAVFLRDVKSVYVKSFQNSFVITFLSPEAPTSINTHVPFHIITDYDVGLLSVTVSVSLHLLVPQYGTLPS